MITLGQWLILSFALFCQASTGDNSGLISDL